MRPAVLLVAACLCWSSGHGLHINKLTGAYEDIVVAIHQSVEPDDRIIENIKALFRSASVFLHRATRGLVHFGSVTIAVPDTWPTRPHAKRTTASLFSVSDVRVAAENPQYGDTPYTLQPRGCGERGEYVHLTPRFLGQMNGSIAEAYGSPAYLLVHEWAHYRYGVFDEYGDPESFRYPSLYCEFGMVRASACSSGIKFQAATDTGEPCRIYKGCRVSTKCKAHFEQSADNPVTSSIMFMPYLKGVTDFCDSANKTHNIFAPNKHNHLCDRRSTWEIISANDDFTQLAQRSPDEVAEVKFTEVQKREGALGRVIFALDVSGSMTTSDRIGHLKAAASQVIQALILDDMEVGIVKFNGNASVVSALTPVEESTRKQLVERVQKLTAGGSTCIGCALQESLKVVVNTIAFGTDAEEKLEELALRTGGKPFAIRDGQSNVAVTLESAFLASAFALLDDVKRPVVGQANFTTKLRYPGGKACDECQETVLAVAGNYRTFKVTGVAKPGTWTLEVSCNSSTCNEDVHVRATSLTKDAAVEPVLARAFLKRTEVTSAPEAAIYAEVTKGAHVVLHAKVTATVIQPRGGGQVQVELFDNGLGADVTANDGIYSGYFTQFDGVGRYSVSACVTGGNDSVIVKGRKASGGLPASQPPAPGRDEASQPADVEVGGIPLANFVFVDEDIEQAEPRVLHSERAPEFARWVEGGSFRLAREIEESSIPPGPIQDLQVEDSFVGDNGTHVVILSWTCPGGHMDSGNASKIELRGSTSMTLLVDDFDSALEVLDEAAEGGNITSGPAGTRQRLRFSVPDELLSVARNDSQQHQQRRGFYFAARVWNEANLYSSVSNIVAVTFERPPPLLTSREIVGAPWWVILVSVLAPVLFVAMVAVVALKVADRHKRKCITFVVT
ncbi:hypothetical protein HPB50_004226 [Hyalomma asiaticum]|uniref:Uncharacterized protein n=1 Tax=Hyalomma asiaticum TaxID=266040 RepID=A0ACB7RJC3_HYAAI|nr:hypothetical protein HPB50_004226 [Hyalomma asiaticum]